MSFTAIQLTHKVSLQYEFSCGLEDYCYSSVYDRYYTSPGEIKALRVLMGTAAFKLNLCFIAIQLTHKVSLQYVFSCGLVDYCYSSVYDRYYTSPEKKNIQEMNLF